MVTIPIIFVVGTDPVDLGLVTSIRRPTSNLTGVNIFAEVLTPKRQELLHELVPTAPLVAMLVTSPRQHEIVGCGSAAHEFHLAAKRSHFHVHRGLMVRSRGAPNGDQDMAFRKREGRMALSLRDVRRDPVANRALEELMHHYTVAEEKSRLVLTKKAGNMKLFLNDLDDLHQWDFIHNQEMVKEIERLRVLLATIEQKRESWKVRALMAEAQLLEATAKTSNNGRCQNVSDVRYASLKRFLAKQFHPDYAPGQGIEKIVRNEFFKEIWNEIDRLDQRGSPTRFATARSSSAA